jgi:hypothetical protein
MLWDFLFYFETMLLVRTDDDSWKKKINELRILIFIPFQFFLLFSIDLRLRIIIVTHNIHNNIRWMHIYINPIVLQMGGPAKERSPSKQNKMLFGRVKAQNATKNAREWRRKSLTDVNHPFYLYLGMKERSLPEINCKSNCKLFIQQLLGFAPDKI